MNALKTSLTILVFASSLAACVGEVDESDTQQPPAPGGGATAGGEDNTFDHDNSSVDPYEIIERIATEGPPRYSARMHGCTKLRYRTIGNVLASLGVDMESSAPLSAGLLYRNGYNALGGANYNARARENIAMTTSATSRLFDVFAAAAPEIIANLPQQTRCHVAGVGAEMFDENDQCQESGVSCLLGVPATPAHIELCDLSVSRASSPEVGRELAVAALLAAAHTCE